MSINKIIILLAAVAFSIAGTSAKAALVTSTNSQTFAFDVSGHGATTFVNFGWCSNKFCSNSAIADELLAVGASMQMDFGTTAGAKDIGTATFTNSLAQDLFIFSTPLSPNQSISASLTTLFITLVYVDDVFGVGSLQLLDTNGFPVDGMPVPTAVPLPAALPLFLAGIAGIGFAGRKKRRRSLATQAG